MTLEVPRPGKSIPHTPSRSPALAALAAVVLRLAPLWAFASLPSATSVRGACGTATGLCALFGLVKILGAPAESDWFWAQCILIFTACSIDSFLLDRVVLGVHEWALAAAARKAKVPAPLSEEAAAAHRIGASADAGDDRGVG